MITSGTTTINPIALKSYTKERVRELLKGKLADDFEVIYAKIRAYILVDEVKPKDNFDKMIETANKVFKDDKAPTNSAKHKKS